MRPRPPRLLLFGYNGANNTGSEARLLAVIQDVRAVLGPSAPITVPTIDVKEEGRYLEGDPHVRIVPFSTHGVIALARLVRHHDLVVLVEGSCFMDTWATALLLAYLWVLKCAGAMRKPCLAYAVDAGRLTSTNQKRVRREANKAALIITRTQAAADRLRSWGVTAPTAVTADPAFSLQMDPAEGLLARVWPEAASGVAGLALVDFHRWPVIVKPWGRARDRYRWPFYHSSSCTRRQASENLVERFAAEADRIVETHRRGIALICMEQLDEPLAQEVRRRMVHRERARVFSSREYTVSQMTSILRSLDALIASRYHACVLAMAAAVPMVAVGHDLRLRDLFDELDGLGDLFVDVECPDFPARLTTCVDRVLSDPEPSRVAIRRGHDVLRARALRNREILESFVQQRGWR